MDGSLCGHMHSLGPREHLQSQPSLSNSMLACVFVFVFVFVFVVLGQGFSVALAVLELTL